MNFDGILVVLLCMEIGFWCFNVDICKVDVLMVVLEGWVEVWIGNIDGVKIELVIDVVVCIEEVLVFYIGGQCFYGQVEGDLLWIFDWVIVDVFLQFYMWVCFKRF